MLAIRLQRTGRTGHAQFRVIVQDSRFSPKRGRVVAYAGSYDPHTKVASLRSDVISSYLDKGAQPSDRVARLLKKEGVKLPQWVSLAEPKKRVVRNPDKLRRNRPVEAKAPVPATPPEAVSPGTPTEEIKASEPDSSADLPADLSAGESSDLSTGGSAETEASAKDEASTKDEVSAEAETSMKTEVVKGPVAEVPMTDQSPEVLDKQEATKEEPTPEKSPTEAGKEEQKS